MKFSAAHIECRMSVIGSTADNICSHRAFPTLTHLRHGPEHPLPDPAGALAFLAARTKTAQLGTDGYLAAVATQLQKRLRSLTGSHRLLD